MDKGSKSEEMSNKTLVAKTSKQNSAKSSAQCSSADTKEDEEAESGVEKCEKSEAEAENLDPDFAGETSNESSTPQSGVDCPVCLQTVTYPVRLPCQHVFCFLCIKGKRYGKNYIPHD